MKIIKVTRHLVEYNKIINIENQSKVTPGYQIVMKSLAFSCSMSAPVQLNMTATSHNCQLSIWTMTIVNFFNVTKIWVYICGLHCISVLQQLI